MTDNSRYYINISRNRRRKSNSLITLIKRLLLLIILISAALVVLTFLNQNNKSVSKTVSKTASKITTKTKNKPDMPSVCLDPGHGGDDPGATQGNITEAQINLYVALEVRSILQNDGYTVYMTRTDNGQTMDNTARADYCNSVHASILLAIHHNFFTDPTTDYTTALFGVDQGKVLANAIAQSVSQQLNLSDDGISQFDDNELIKSNMPSALIESFFMTNTDEYNSLLSGNSRLDQEAQGIAGGIVNYFTKPQPSADQINGTNLVITNE